MKESSDGYLKLCVCTNWIWMIFYFIGIVSHYHCNSKPFDSQKQQAQQSATKIMIFFALVSIWGFPNDRYSSLDGANITLFPSEEASNHHPRVQRCIGLMSCALSLTQQKLPRIRFGVPTDVPHFCKKNWESGDGSEWLFLVIFAFHGGQFWYLHTHTQTQHYCFDDKLAASRKNHLHSCLRATCWSCELWTENATAKKSNTLTNRWQWWIACWF